MTGKTESHIDGYSIRSHGGIGDEHGEEKDREGQKHNLSGSCHELAVRIGKETLRILVDVGAYQGPGGLERNLADISKSVGAIILSHPHMDHIGDLPRLFTDEVNFQGRVFSSSGTKQAAEIALLDAAKILAREHEKKRAGYEKMMQEIAEALYTISRENKSGEKRVKRTSSGNRMAQSGEVIDRRQSLADANELLQRFGVDPEMKNWKEKMQNNEPEKPAYTVEDVYTTLSAIETHSVKDGWKELVPGQIAFRFYNAGHIIGSVSVLFRITNNKKSKYVLFSGDLGSYKWDMHPTGIATPPHNLRIDTVMIESTYGNKVRGNFEEGLQDFKHNLTEDLKKYRRITIATFAMDRTQNILSRLVKMKIAGEIDAEIILDSPAGINHTAAYINQAEHLDDTIFATKAQSIKNLLPEDFEEREKLLLEEFAANINLKNGHYTIATKENRDKLFTENGKPKIVLTSSGMADGGMVLSHLEANISDPTTVFYFPGYLVPGTLGYALANEHQVGGQKKRVKILGKEFAVKARMKQFNFLSGHGDAEDLRAWLGALKLPKDSNILVVHGDVNGSSLEFKNGLVRKGYEEDRIRVPNIGEENFFPFENVPSAPMKSDRRRAPHRGPLVISPAPARKKIIPLAPAKKVRKTVSSVLTSRKPEEKIQGTVVQNNGDTKKYDMVVSSAKEQFIDFFLNLVSLPIPFLEHVKNFYKDLFKKTKLDEDIIKAGEELERTKKNIYDLNNPDTTKKQTRPRKSEPDVKNLETNLTALQIELVQMKKNQSGLNEKIDASLIKRKLTAQEFSTGIIESLGYSTKDIAALPGRVELEELKDIDAVMIDTCKAIIESTGDISGITQIERIAKIAPGDGGMYMPDDMQEIAAFSDIQNPARIHELLASLISRINPDYVSPEIKEKKKPPAPAGKRVRPNYPVPVRTTPVVTSIDSERGKKDKGEREEILKQMKRYRIYHADILESIMKDITRLNMLKTVKEEGGTPSRGKYLNYDLKQIESELKNKRRARGGKKRTLKNTGLLVNTEDYKLLTEQLKNVNKRIGRA